MASFESGGGNFAAFVGYDDRAMAEYAQHYSTLNVWASHTDRLPSGWVRTSSMVYPDHLLRRTEFHADWLAPQDLFHGLGYVVHRHETRAVTLGFIRSERAGAFETEELLVIRRLMPHLQAAVVIAPLPASALPFGHGVAAAVFCSEPGAAIGGLAASLQQLYAMLPAEAALTEALVSGQSLKEFAEQRQTTMNTVRTQLKSAAAKAGAKRQLDLVRVVLTGPAVWRRG